MTAWFMALMFSGSVGDDSTVPVGESTDMDEELALECALRVVDLELLLDVVVEDSVEVVGCTVLVLVLVLWVVGGGV